MNRSEIHDIKLNNVILSKAKNLFFLFSMFLFSFISVIQVQANICPLVGIGDLKEDFEKVYGKPTNKFTEVDKNIFLSVKYLEGKVEVLAFTRNVTMTVILRLKDAPISYEEAKALVEKHIPSDCGFIGKVDQNYQGEKVTQMFYQSEKLLEIYKGWANIRQDRPVLINVSLFYTKRGDLVEYINIGVQCKDMAKEYRDELEAKDAKVNKDYTITPYDPKVPLKKNQKLIKDGRVYTDLHRDPETGKFTKEYLEREKIRQQKEQEEHEERLKNDPEYRKKIQKEAQEFDIAKL